MHPDRGIVELWTGGDELLIAKRKRFQHEWQLAAKDGIAPSGRPSDQPPTHMAMTCSCGPLSSCSHSASTSSRMKRVYQPEVCSSL